MRRMTCRTGSVYLAGRLVPGAPWQLDVAGGQLAGAAALPDEALDLSLAIHINRNMAPCLVAFARLVFAEGDPEHAALLAGAAAGLRQRPRRRAWPVLRPGEADLVAQVRQAQGAVRSDEIFAAGSRLSQREAVAHPGPAPDRHPGALTHGLACPARHRHGRPDLLLPGSPGHLWPNLPCTSPRAASIGAGLAAASWAAQPSP